MAIIAQTEAIRSIVTMAMIAVRSAIMAAAIAQITLVMALTMHSNVIATQVAPTIHRAFQTMTIQIASRTIPPPTLAYRDSQAMQMRVEQMRTQHDSVAIAPNSRPQTKVRALCVSRDSQHPHQVLGHVFPIMTPTNLQRILIHSMQIQHPNSNQTATIIKRKHRWLRIRWLVA